MASFDLGGVITMATLAEAIVAANALNEGGWSSPIARDPMLEEASFPVYTPPLVPTTAGSPMGLTPLPTLAVGAPAIGEVIGMGPNGPIYWGALASGVSGPVTSFPPGVVVPVVTAAAPRPSGLQPIFPVVAVDPAWIGGTMGRVIFAEIDNRQVSGIRFGTLPQVVMPYMRRP